MKIEQTQDMLIVTWDEDPDPLDPFPFDLLDPDPYHFGILDPDPEIKNGQKIMEI